MNVTHTLARTASNYKATEMASKSKDNNRDIQDIVTVGGSVIKEGLAYTLGIAGNAVIPLGATFSAISGAYHGYQEASKQVGSGSDLFPLGGEMEVLSGVASGFVGGLLDGAIQSAITVGIVGVVGGGAVTAGLVGAALGLTGVGIHRWANSEPPFSKS